MVTPVAEVVKVNWQQVLPPLALFRALGLALHVRQICVGMLAAFLVACGERLLGGIPLSPNLPGMLFPVTLLSWVWLPWVDLVFPLVPTRAFGQFGIITVSSQAEWSHLILAWLRFAWVLSVGSLAGGVLVRRAGMEFAKEESVGLLATIRFVLARSVDYLSAPALPLAVVGALGGLLWLAGLFARVLPGGEYLASLLWAPLLILGIAMAVLLTTVALSWPLMIAAVSINGGDGFDALSRGFGFVFDRWRYYACCVAIMTAYGCLTMTLLMAVLHFGNYLTVISMNWGANGWNAQGLPAVLPDFVWPFGLALVVRGFAYSFFWSSIAIMYFVLRQNLDNADMQEIYLEDTSPDADGLQALVNPVPTETAVPNLLPIINQP